MSPNNFHKFRPFHHTYKRSSFYHPTVACFVLNQAIDQVLFIYHKKFNSWAWLGGHVESHESPYQAAIRELFEESGLKAQPHLRPPLAWHLLWAQDHYHINQTYLFLVNDQDQLTVNLEETMGIQWFPLTDLDEIVREAHMLPIYKTLAQRAKDVLTYSRRPLG